MSEFKMTRTNGILLAIMNVLVREFGVGSFVVQLNSGSPSRLGGGRKDYWASGYTDTGRAVSCDFWLRWEEGRSPNLVEAKVSFGHCSGNGGRPEVFHEKSCGYSPERGIVVHP